MERETPTPPYGEPPLVGTVKWFSPERGFGFIAPQDGSADIFVHHTALVMDGFRTLEADQPVGYRVIPGRKGPEAVDVTVAPLRDY